MCGRLAIIAYLRQLQEYLELPGDAPEGFIERYNLPPSYQRAGETVWEKVPALYLHNGQKRLSMLTWPLVPSWAKGQLPRFSTANCRSESDEAFSATVAKKRTFSGAWRRQQRCLVLASWFYEWDQRSQPKTPYRVYPLNEPFFTFAGLWDRSISHAGQAIESFTMITSEPNQLLKDVGHHRAPVVIEPENWDIWLAGDNAEAEKLLVPPASDEMAAVEISKAINNPTFDDKALIEAVDNTSVKQIHF